MTWSERARGAVVAALLALPGLVAAEELRLAPGAAIGFTAKITGSSFEARSSAASGRLAWDAATGAVTSATIELPVTSLKTGVETRDEHMHGKYLASTEHPSIRFEAGPQSFPAKAGATLPLTGELVVKGVRRPLTVQVRVDALDAAGLTVACEFPVDVTTFGIPQPKFAVVKMEPVVRATASLRFTRGG